MYDHPLQTLYGHDSEVRMCCLLFVCLTLFVCLFVCLFTGNMCRHQHRARYDSQWSQGKREREGEEREKMDCSSGVQDGTCIIHTVRRGHYMHTLLPRKERHKCVVRHALISPLGRLLVYTEDKLARSKVSHTPSSSYPHYVWYSGKYS